MWRWYIPVGVALSGVVGTVFLYALVRDESLARIFALSSTMVFAFAVFQSLVARR